MMLVTVLDTETARETGGIVEIAGVRVETQDRKIWDWHHTLIHPGDKFLPMDPVCRAAHHIDDAEVIGQPPISEITNLRPGFYESSNILAAHNAPFDASVMPEEYWMTNHPDVVRAEIMGAPPTTAPQSGGAAWIDTLRCAQHIWPDAPRFGNQVLRYHLGLDVSDMPDEAGGIVHRALYDTWCTAKLLIRMLELHTAMELVELSGEPVLLLGEMRFGKYRGRTWESVARTDSGYLRWIADKSDMDYDTKYTARHWLDRR